MEETTTSTNQARRGRRPGTKNRSKAEIAAELRRKLAAVECRAIAQECASHPEIAEIDTEIQKATTAMAKFVRWESQWEENRDNFIKRAQEWVDNGQIAAKELPAMRANLEALKNQRTAKLQEIAAQNQSENATEAQA